MSTVVARRPEKSTAPSFEDSLEDGAVVVVSPPAARPIERPTIEPNSPATDEVAWRDVAPYVETFVGAQKAEERARKRRRLRHKRFILSAPFWAGVVVLVELIGLLWLVMLQMQTMREADALDEQIPLVQLEISRTRSQLAAAATGPKLEKWAAELGYRPVLITDMDDVTSNAPLPKIEAENALD